MTNEIANDKLYDLLNEISVVVVFQFNPKKQNVRQ